MDSESNIISTIFKVVYSGYRDKSSINDPQQIIQENVNKCMICKQFINLKKYKSSYLRIYCVICRECAMIVQPIVENYTNYCILITICIEKKYLTSRIALSTHYDESICVQWISPHVAYANITNNITLITQRYNNDTMLLFIMARQDNNSYLSMLVPDVMLNMLKLIY